MRALTLVLLGVTGGCSSRPLVELDGYPEQMKADYALFEARCSRCHGLERPLNARVASGGWVAYVERMSRHPGAGLPPAEQRRIADFLEYHHHRQEGGN